MGYFFRSGEDFFHLLDSSVGEDGPEAFETRVPLFVTPSTSFGDEFFLPTKRFFFYYTKRKGLISKGNTIFLKK